MPRAKKSAPTVAKKPIRTLSALGKELGVAKQTCANWVKAGCPRESDGSFDPAAVAEWARRRTGATTTAGDTGGGMDDVQVAAAQRRANLQWSQARAELWRLQVAEKRGDLVSAQDVDVFVDRLGAFIQQDLLRRIETWNEQIEGMSRRERGEFLEQAARTMLKAWEDDGMQKALRSKRGSK